MPERKMHAEPETDAPAFKMTIPLGADAWHGFGTEVVWIEGSLDGTLRLRNTPFFAKGLSYLDVVDVKIEDDELLFYDVRQRGGHSTYRLILEDAATEAQFSERWKALAAHGCTYESFADLRLYAVDVPSVEAVKAVYQLLQAGEREGIWDFEEGHFAGAK
jgi:hypothetical protein